MLSILFPTNIKFYLSSDYIKIQTSAGIFIKKKGDYTIKTIVSSEGIRLYIRGTQYTKMSTSLLKRHQLVLGLIRGFKLRLRLIGVGFRAYIREITFSHLLKGVDNIYIDKYRKNRMYNMPTVQRLLLKIGYSHETAYPILVKTNISIKVSRPESRSKGTLLLIKGNVKSKVSQIAAEIRNLRIPNIYKGKGIQYHGEKVILKKGKNQNK